MHVNSHRECQSMFDRSSAYFLLLTTRCPIFLEAQPEELRVPACLVAVKFLDLLHLGFKVSVRVDYFTDATLFPGIIQIEHGSNGIDPQTIHVVFL